MHHEQRGVLLLAFSLPMACNVGPRLPHPGKLLGGEDVFDDQATGLSVFGQRLAARLRIAKECANIDHRRSPIAPARQRLPVLKIQAQDEIEQARPRPIVRAISTSLMVIILLCNQP